MYLYLYMFEIDFFPDLPCILKTDVDLWHRYFLPKSGIKFNLCIDPQQS